VAVFVDGCYWHGCPDHFKLPQANQSWWEQKISTTRDRDQETTELLSKAGWTVVRIWEHQAPEDAADVIELAVRGQTSSAHYGFPGAG
jgi:DNA mismatch endonuclease (patch repair protein)